MRHVPGTLLTRSIPAPGFRLDPRHLWGIRTLANDRFLVASVVLVSTLALALGFVAPPWWGVDLRNYGWALDRLLVGLPVYQMPVPDNPGDFTVYFTPPPYSALLGGPFAPFPSAWAAVGLLGLLAGVTAAAATLPGFAGTARLPRRAWLGVMVATAGFAPALTVVLLGNAQGLVVAGLGLAWWAEWRGRSLSSGLGLALAVMLKLQPGMLLARTVALGQARILGAVLATASVVVLASLPLIGIGPYRDFLASLAARAAPTVERSFNLSPAGALLPYPWSLGALVVGALLIAWSARRDRRRVSFARGVAIGLACWPIDWFQYASVTLVAMAATLGRRTWRWYALAYTLLAIASPWTWGLGLLVIAWAAGRTEPEESSGAP